MTRGLERREIGRAHALGSMSDAHAILETSESPSNNGHNPMGRDFRVRDFVGDRVREEEFPCLFG